MSSSFRILLSLIAGIFFGFIAIVLSCLLTVTSFAEFAGEIRSPEIISAILMSLETSIAVVLLALLFGIPDAHILATKRFKPKFKRYHKNR